MISTIQSAWASAGLHYGETYEGKLIDAKGIQARYVQLHSAGSTSNGMNHYIEVEVYGKPAADGAGRITAEH